MKGISEGQQSTEKPGGKGTGSWPSWQWDKLEGGVEDISRGQQINPRSSGSGTSPSPHRGMSHAEPISR